ncbi:MAG: helix-turn-helix transcriptional regulator [Firmicutes bacterium]|nr:helix-turn-helix transcriptional regulator [Bacillota bacterium]
MIIHKAKEELLTSNSSIKEIAYKLKFSDEFYFSRFFKKHTGIPPSKYRIQNKL